MAVHAVAGESYAGVYVPLLAQTVLDGNGAGAMPTLNLKVRTGFMHLRVAERTFVYPCARV